MPSGTEMDRGMRLRLAVAEAKGATWQPSPSRDCEYLMGPEHYATRHADGRLYWDEPWWDMDIAAAWELESEVEEAGPDAMRTYGRALEDECQRAGHWHPGRSHLFAIAHAPPEARCIAYLRWRGVDTRTYESEPLGA